MMTSKSQASDNLAKYTAVGRHWKIKKIPTKIRKSSKEVCWTDVPAHLSKLIAASAPFPRSWRFKLTSPPRSGGFACHMLAVREWECGKTSLPSEISGRYLTNPSSDVNKCLLYCVLWTDARVIKLRVFLAIFFLLFPCLQILSIFTCSI